MRSMALEIALIDVKAGHEAQFAAAYDQARHLISAADGCHSVRMTQGIETPTRFVLLVEWESVAAHEHFRASDAFPRWRALIGPHFEASPQVEHFEDVERA
jgi:heme-degrading monooxygenase HmoA